MFATKAAKSLQGNMCCQVLVADKDCIALYPMKKEAEYPLALMEFAKEVGAPDVLVCDWSKTQNQRDAKLLCTQIGTRSRLWRLKLNGQIKQSHTLDSSRKLPARIFMNLAC